MTNKDKDIVKIARALSDSTRVRLLKEVAMKGSISCGDAEKVAELSQPTVSHHIKILTDAGLLIADKEGRHIRITVNKKVLNDFIDLINGSLLRE